jgi:hypothetical protein
MLLLLKVTSQWLLQDKKFGPLTYHTLSNDDSVAAEKLNPTLEPLDKRISPYIDGEPVRLDGKPRLSGILDTVRDMSRVHHPSILTLSRYAPQKHMDSRYQESSMTPN